MGGLLFWFGVCLGFFVCLFFQNEPIEYSELKLLRDWITPNEKHLAEGSEA